MPGMELRFKCPCGFEQGGVEVGATERGRFVVAMCQRCHKLASHWREGERRVRPICRKCGKALTLIADPGSWGPAALQMKFPDDEPWIVAGGECFEEGPTEDEAEQLQSVRVLCPRCGQCSMECESETLWD